MSIMHLIILFLIVLLIFGPTRLEGIGVALGRAIRGFKKGMEGEDLPSSSTPAAPRVNEENKTPKS